MLFNQVRLVAAMHARGEDLVRIADDLLNCGTYTHALGELVTLHPATIWEAAPWFARALKELAIPLPSRRDAVNFLVGYHFAEIVEVRETPFDALHNLYAMFSRPIEANILEEAGIEFDLLHGITGWVSEYEYGTMERHYGPANAKQMDQSLAELDRQVIAFGSKWLREQAASGFDSDWLSWNGGTVQKLAQAIGAERAFDRLPILADALEEAGCTHTSIIGHCREPAKHVRSCWVVDLLLGKE